MPPKIPRAASTPRPTRLNPSPPPPNNPSSSTLTGELPSDTAAPLDEEPKILGMKGDGDAPKSAVSGKAKKTVKKTVKVVKKVIKKVPKKSLKPPIHTNLLDSVNTNNTDNNSLEVPNSVGGKVEEVKERELMGVDDEVVGHSSDQVPLRVKEEEGVHLKESDHAIVGGSVDGNEINEEGVTVEESQVMEGDHDNVGGKVNGNEEKAVEEGIDGECRDEKEKSVKTGKLQVGEGKLSEEEWEVIERGKRRRKTQVFIGGLSKDAKEEDVREVVGKVGEIVDLRVVMNDKTGKNKGFAFVRFSNADEAKMAIDEFSKVEICGKECSVQPVEGNDTILLGNIDKKWKDQDVIKLLHDAGIENIDKVTAMVDPTNVGHNRGFAFVEFETIKSAQIAYRNLQNKNIFGKNKKIKVSWAEPLKELGDDNMLKVKTVFAEFIPSSWDEKKVRDAFEKFGEIEDIILGQNLRTTKRKDIAFISYKTRESAIECIESFSHDSTDGDRTEVKIKVSFAKSSAKTKNAKPPVKPVAREAAKTKPRAYHSNVRMIEPRNMMQPAMPRYGIQMSEGSSTNVELVRLLREQASWRPSAHARPSSSSVELRYSTPFSGMKRQYSAVGADPHYEDMHLYPHRRLDASFPVASSSRSLVPPNVLTSSLANHQWHSAYPSAGTVYGARNYPSDIQARENERRSDVYRRY